MACRNTMKYLLEQIDARKQLLKHLPPLVAETKNSLDEWLRVELTYSSNAIEGNTLTRIETAEIMQKGINAVVTSKPLRDQLEAENHRKALDYVLTLSTQKARHQRISDHDILMIHKHILTGINNDWAGRFRESEVFVAGTDVNFPSAHSVPYLMDEFFQWLQETRNIHPVLVTSEAHMRFVSIHPFVDGNGRTARLLMNLVLLIHGYPLTSIAKKDRTAYLDAVNQAQIQENMQPITEIVAKAVLRSIDKYIAASQGKPVFKRQKKSTGKLLKIGALAAKTNETIYTLRYWTKQGLLHVTAHTKGGYQLYSPAMIRRVKKIRRLQSKKRLTLDEIGKMFSSD